MFSWGADLTRRAPFIGPRPQPRSHKLMELIDDVQERLKEWEYKQFCDIAHEMFLDEEREKGN